MKVEELKEILESMNVPDDAPQPMKELFPYKYTEQDIGSGVTLLRIDRGDKNICVEIHSESSGRGIEYARFNLLMSLMKNGVENLENNPPAMGRIIKEGE